MARDLRLVAARQHTSDLRQLLLYSGVALVIMAIICIALSWLTAGRVLRPLRKITSSAQDISATNLHERLGLEGPRDELKDLGDTIDQLLERLDGSFQAQRQFVANASHELRTPLATMRASLDVALAKPGPLPDQMASLAGRLHAELDHVDLLLESFLALARAQRAPTSGEVPLSLDRLVASALEAHAGGISELDLVVERANRDEACVTGDGTLLARMVDNVIDNSVRYNQRGGWIRVTTETGSDTARLVVENGGPVIDDEGVGELALPFRRLGAERTGTDNGVGLGLSIVAAIAESHGGRLELQAIADGGMRALIELPLAVGVLAGAPA